MNKILIILTIVVLVLLNVRAWSFWGKKVISQNPSNAVATLYSGTAEVPGVKQALDMKLRNFTNNPHINELYVQHILDLLSAEMAIVEHLRIGDSGYTVECALKERNRRLLVAVPSVISLFESILDFALYEPKISNAYNRDMVAQKKSMRMRLRKGSSQKFLRRTYDTLEDYYLVLHRFQSELAFDEQLAA